MAKNSTSIVGKLLLSANRVPRSFQEAFYFVVRTVLSTIVIGAVVTQLGKDLMHIPTTSPQLRKTR